MVEKSSARRFASRLGLGRVALYGYYRPIGLARKMVAEGGPIEQHRTRAGRRAMREAAARLPEIAPPSGSYAVPVTFLSGEAFWDQTLFCIASLQCHADKRVEPVIFDDGTLAEDARAAILRAVPWARFVSSQEMEARLETRLPLARFPTLRARREAYVHLRKLTDLHEPEAFSLVLDSDMLFFRRPDALLAWMDAPSGVLTLKDVVRSYGYSEALMTELARGPLPRRTNVGLYGLHGSIIDYDYLEHCCRVQIERERTSYLQEQSLTALLVAGQPARILPREDYRVMPDLVEGRAPRAAMHHYVAQSKRSYFQHGWRRVMRQMRVDTAT